MSARRAERLVNLVICLLSTRQFLSAERIRAAVPGYTEEDGTAQAEEAFKRMFERDKSELRELGVPLETGRNRLADTDDGYRIARSDYELPDIELTGAESAAVGLAVRLWQSAGLGRSAHGALRKLRAAGIDVDTHSARGIEPRVEASDAAFEPCLDAVRAGQPITFDYQRPDASAAQRREVEPWGVVSWRGRWYLVGHDRDRDAARSFRLSRIRGAVRPTGTPGEVVVPAGVDLSSIVAAAAPQSSMTARVLIRPDRASGLRRGAVPVGSGPDGDEYDVSYADAETLAERIVGYGAGVVVLDPPEVRDAVIGKLRLLIAAAGR